MNSMAFYAGVYLVGVFMASVSQVILKMAAQKKRGSLVKEYANPLVVFAYILFVLTTFMTIYAYKKVPLSLGSILESASYLYVTIFGAAIFKERITPKKVTGSCFNTAGYRRVFDGPVATQIGLPLMGSIIVSRLSVTR